MGRLIVLSGPSCVGKGPLYRPMGRLHPHLAEGLAKVVLYNSREPRPGEIDGLDYHFRTREAIQALEGKRSFSVFDVRGDLQALDLDELSDTLARGDALFEGNPRVSSALLDLVHGRAAEHLSIFLSPLSREEILEATTGNRATSLSDLITDIMRRKLLRRTARQKGLLSLKDLTNIETRAGSAPDELKQAWRYDWVIPNHDGEDSENWDAFYYPIGDARTTLLAFVELLQGRPAACAEKWGQELIP